MDDRGIVAATADGHHPASVPRNTAMPSRIVRLPATAEGGERTPVGADRLIAGRPVQTVANAWSDPANVFHCGVWESDVGAWRVRYDEHEFCHLLSGRLRLVDDDGTETVFGPGESFVITAGFEGRWEVLEPARKLYAVYEPAG